MEATLFSAGHRESSRENRSHRPLSFSAKMCVISVVTPVLLFILGSLYAYGDHGFVKSDFGRHMVELLGLTPPELFAVVGCMLGILEVIFVLALVRIRKKTCK
jgi:hypothetical protein